jgi:DNA-binding protein H-NS
MRISSSASIVAGCAARADDLESMALEELWTLREAVRSILSEKLEVQRRELHRRLEALGLKSGDQPNISPRRGRKVPPKFQNPAQPSQTWNGRGSQPSWLRHILEGGSSIEEFRIREPTRNFDGYPASVGRVKQDG